MKKWMAAALSTVMAVGTCSGAAMAGETVSFLDGMGTFEGTQDEIQIAVTADGESLTASLTASKNEAGDVSISGNVVLPESIMGEETTLSLDDVIRVVEGDFYLNVDSVLGLYQELTGDPTLTALKTMVGIDEPWLVVPALELPESQDAEISEELNAALIGCLAPFEIAESETGATIVFDGPALAEFLRSIEEVADTYGEELTGLLTDSMSDIDYKTVFADYIQAAAEGIHAVDPDTSVEMGVELINTLIDSVMQEAESEIGLETDSGIDLGDESTADELEEALEEVTIKGQIVIGQTETALTVTTDVDVTEIESGETVSVSVVVKSSNDGVYAEIAAPEAATALRDVVKNAVTIYYGMLVQSEEVQTETEVTAE